MSASLVGSEMCIRDSVPNVPKLRNCPCPASHSRRRARPKAQSSDPEAVSYTHLTLPTICSV
eukprot:3231881-Alexandrium_andersonii.AAC.1